MTFSNALSPDINKKQKLRTYLMIQYIDQGTS